MRANKMHMGALFFSIAFLGVVLPSSWDSHKVAVEKQQQQDKAIDDFRQWKAAYAALEPVKKEWQESYPSASEMKDIYTLYKQIEEFGTINPDTLVIEKIEPVSLNGIALGLTRVCLANAGTPGLNITASRTSDLVDSLKSLFEKKFVQAKTIKITVSPKESKAVATLGGFCVLVRD